MDVFLYKYDPLFNGKTGKRIRKPIINQEIKQFESILIEVLKDLSFNVHELSRFDVSRSPHPKSGISILFHGDKQDYPNIDLFYMQMHLKTQFQLDQNGWGMSNSNLPHLTNFTINSLSGDITGLKKVKLELENMGTKLPQSGRIFKKLPKKEYILVALQTPNDTVLQKYSDMGVSELVSKINEISKKIELIFLVKPHPNTLRNRKLIFHLARKAMFRGNVKIFMGDISEAIINSAGVIVLNSGVGFEALTYKKPVYTFGQADYSIAAHGAREMAIEEWCHSLPRKNTYSFFNEYLKYNIFISDANSARLKIAKVIKKISKNKYYKNVK